MHEQYLYIIFAPAIASVVILGLMHIWGQIVKEW
jgi:hypothetical protein